MRTPLEDDVVTTPPLEKPESTPQEPGPDQKQQPERLETLVGALLFHAALNRAVNIRKKSISMSVNESGCSRNGRNFIKAFRKLRNTQFSSDEERFNACMHWVQSSIEGTGIEFAKMDEATEAATGGASDVPIPGEPITPGGKILHAPAGIMKRLKPFGKAH